MWIYALILSAVALLWLISLSLPGKQRAVRLFLALSAILLLTLFMGFRDKVGADWDSYEDLFQIYSNVPAGQVLTAAKIEPCYAILNYLASAIGADVHMVNAICALLMLVGLVRFAYLAELDACMVLFLATPYLLFAVGMGYTRQAVAIGIGFAGLGYWAKGHRMRSTACILLATGFHVSALFLFVLLAIKNTRRFLIIMPPVLLIGFLFIKIVMTSYLSLYVKNTQDLQSHGVWLRLGIVSVGAVILMVQRNRWNLDPGMFKLLKAGSLILLGLIPVAFLESTLADRICLYLFFVFLVASGRVLEFSKPHLRFLAVVMLIAITYGSFVLWFAASPYAVKAWVPYRFSFVSDSRY